LDQDHVAHGAERKAEGTRMSSIGQRQEQQEGEEEIT
jgi:hypothetical protein